MFPQGMIVKADTKQVLTDNINEIFFIIGSFIDGCKQIKSGQPMKNIDLSASVPRAGVEPARVLPHWCLRPTRLPIPPPGLVLEFLRVQRYNFLNKENN